MLFLGWAIFVLQSDVGMKLTEEILGRRAPGLAIDQGFYAIILGVVLGVLSEISEALHELLAKKEDRENQ